MNVHWMVFYNLKVFCSDMKFKMAATAGLSLTLDPMGKMFQGHFNDHSFTVWVQAVHLFQRGRSLKFQPIRAYYIIGPGSHVEYPTGTKNRNFPFNLQGGGGGRGLWFLVLVHLLPSLGVRRLLKFQPIRAYYIIGPGSHVEYPTGTKNRNFVEDHPRNILAKFGSNCPSVFGEEA
jgi:hypothetical protein